MIDAYLIGVIAAYF